MSSSEVYETGRDYEDPATYDTTVLLSPRHPTRYTVLVVVKEGGYPMAFCGHLHRSDRAAEHCRAGQVESYIQWRRDVHHNAEAIRAAHGGFPDVR